MIQQSCMQHVASVWPGLNTTRLTVLLLFCFLLFVLERAYHNAAVRGWRELCTGCHLLPVAIQLGSVNAGDEVQVTWSALDHSPVVVQVRNKGATSHSLDLLSRDLNLQVTRPWLRTLTSGGDVKYIFPWWHADPSLRHRGNTFLTFTSIGQCLSPCPFNSVKVEIKFHLECNLRTSCAQLVLRHKRPFQIFDSIIYCSYAYQKTRSSNNPIQCSLSLTNLSVSIEGKLESIKLDFVLTSNERANELWKLPRIHHFVQ